MKYYKQRGLATKQQLKMLYDLRNDMDGNIRYYVGAYLRVASDRHKNTNKHSTL